MVFEVRLDLGSRPVAVRRPATLEERPPRQGVLLRADLLDDVDGEQAPELGRALGVQPPRQGGQEAARNASPTPVGSTFSISGTAGTVIDSSPCAVDPDAGGAERHDPGADPGEHLLGRPAGLLGDQRGSYSLENRIVRAVDQRPDQVAAAERELLGGVGDEPVAALPALVGVPEHRLGVVRPDQDVVGLADPVDDRLRARSRGPRSSRRRRTRRSGRGRRRWCTRTGRCAGSRETWTESQSTRCRSSQARYSTKSSPTAPTRTGSRPRLPRPKQMFAAQPPRRTSRSSTRNETDSLSSCSTTSESENLPGKDIRWSVAMDPVMSSGHAAEDYLRVQLGSTSGSQYRRGMTELQPPRRTTSSRPRSRCAPTAGPPAATCTSRARARPPRGRRPAPSIHFEDFPREVPKRDIRVSDAAARLANALHLHLD